MKSELKRQAMTLGSLFDGSGGFPLAGAMNGIVPLWASEIEPYPIAVTRSRFPFMQHLGNVMEIDGGQIQPVDVITFGSPCQDMSVAGKRAGMQHTQKGDEAITRSGLFYEAIRIIREMRGATNGKYPTFAVWENVPGAFTSNKGEDFRCVLQELSQIVRGDATIPQPKGGKWNNAGEIVGDGFSIAWRVLDAQYWGVPQRRKRIYLVADFGGERAGKILFKRESVPRNPQPGEKAREGTAADAERGADGGGQSGCLNPDCYAIQDKATRYHGGGATRRDDGCGNGLGISDTGKMHTLTAADRHCIAFMAGQGAKARSIAAVEDGSPTLKGCPSGLNQAPSVVYPAIHPILTAQNARNVESAMRYNGVVYQVIARCLTAAAASPCIDRGQNVVALDCRNIVANSVSGTLQAKENGGYSLNYQNPIVYDARAICCQNTGRGWWNQGEIAETLRTPCGGDSIKANLVVSAATAQANAEIMVDASPTLMAGHEHPIVAHVSKPPRRYIVRRLTPTECARLQGFPDDWGIPDRKESMTDEEVLFYSGVRCTHAEATGKKVKTFKSREALINWYNKLHTDSAEYKMWGNGIALPCAAFVMEGIAKELCGGNEDV